MATPPSQRHASYADLRQAFAVTPSPTRMTPQAAPSSQDYMTIRPLSQAEASQQAPQKTVDTGVHPSNGTITNISGLESDAVPLVRTSTSLDHAALLPPSSANGESIAMTAGSSTSSIGVEQGASVVLVRSSERLASKRASQRHDLSYESPKKRQKTTVSYPIQRTKTSATLATEAFSASVVSSRHRFLMSNHAVFSPLLPGKNFSNAQKTALSDEKEVKEEPLMHQRTRLVQPHSITATLKPYQVEGLEYLMWMHDNGMPCILGDEMGLGKTITTLSLIQCLRERASSTSGQLWPRCLVVCPLSVLATWMSEAARFAPSLPTIRIHGPALAKDAAKRKLRANFKAGIREEEYGLVVTSYEAFKAEASWFKNLTKWTYTILDEGHRIKNESAQLSHALQHVRSDYRVILTGTPLQNNLLELWSLLHWLLPEVFAEGTNLLFKQSFDLTRGTIDNAIIEHAAKLLRLLMIRRTKLDVDLRLPPRKEVVFFAPLTELQRTVYRALITDAQDLFEGTRQTTTASNATAAQTRTLWQRLNNLVVQLRQAAIHPYLIGGVQPEPYEYGDHVILKSTKFIVLRRIVLETVIQNGKKMIIFSGFTGVLDLVEEMLHRVGGDGTRFSYVRFDGQTSRARRDLNVRRFQDTTSKTFVILISTRAGGQGINLTAATEVVFLDEDWNPQMTVQAEARAHRIGQTQPVTIYKIHTFGTVEQQMLQRIRKKQYLSAKVDESSRTNAGNAAAATGDEFNVAQLKSILRKGTLALTSPQANTNEMTEWKMDELIEHFSDKSLEQPSTDVEPANDEDADQSWLNGIERVQCRLFEGENHQRTKKSEPESFVDLAREDRRVDKNRTVKVGEHTVLKASMTCGKWEAVPTISGHTAEFKTPRREFKTLSFMHQKHCMSCSRAGGVLLDCQACPRVFHISCADPRTTVQSLSGIRCSQHRCASCCAGAHDGGGLLYVCRDCDRSWCPDCLDEGHILLEDDLPEYLDLGFPANVRSTYIVCKGCANATSKPSSVSISTYSGSASASSSFSRRPTSASTLSTRMHADSPATIAPQTSKCTYEEPGPRADKRSMGYRL